MSYGCKCKCASFRDHALGVRFSGHAMPTRSNATQLQKTEDRWQADGDAYRRLDKAGYQLPHLDGAAEIEKKATQPIELQVGKVFGNQAKTYQKVNDGEYA